VREEVPQVALVGLSRVGRQPALGLEIVQEARQMSPRLRRQRRSGRQRPPAWRWARRCGSWSRPEDSSFLSEGDCSATAHLRICNCRHNQRLRNRAVEDGSGGARLAMPAIAERLTAASACLDEA
jgi:hypothetical protein